MKKMILNSLPALFASGFLSFSCGEDSSEKSLQETTEKYSWTTSKMPYTCSDGSSGELDVISKNVNVTISGNEIKINATASDDSQAKASTAGMQIKASGYSGLIESDGAFNANQTGTATHQELGSTSVSFNLSGTIANNAWSGNYKFTATFIQAGGSCTYNGTFSGRKQ